jgi:hypothetical protein
LFRAERPNATRQNFSSTKNSDTHREYTLKKDSLKKRLPSRAAAPPLSLTHPGDLSSIAIPPETPTARWPPITTAAPPPPPTHLNSSTTPLSRAAPIANPSSGGLRLGLAVAGRYTGRLQDRCYRHGGQSPRVPRPRSVRGYPTTRRGHEGTKALLSRVLLLDQQRPGRLLRLGQGQQVGHLAYPSSLPTPRDQQILQDRCPRLCENTVLIR